MGSTREIVQIKDGNLNRIHQIKNLSSIHQMVQLSNGTLKHLFELNKKDELVCFENELIKFDNIKSINFKQHRRFIYLVLKNGFRIILPDNFELLTIKDAKIFSKSICEFNKKDFIVLPSCYRTKHIKVEFDPWQFGDHLYVVGVKDWYLKELSDIMTKKNLSLTDISSELNVPYWLIRRNASCKNSINLGYLKKFIKIYLSKNKIYEMIMYSNGLKNGPSAGKFAKLPLKYDKCLSYLDAAVVGDGHIVKNEKQSIIETTDKEYGPILQELFYNVHKYYKGANRINLPGSLAYFYANMLGIPKGKKSKIVEFPKNALLSDNQILLNALRGIIDTDGNVFVDEKRSNFYITSNSYMLILGIVSALLRIGILPHIKKSNKDSTWDVGLSGFELKRLYKKIKYLKHPRKNRELIKLRDKQHINTKIVPDIGKVVKKSREMIGLSSVELAKKVDLSNTSTMEKLGNFSMGSAIKINKIIKNSEIDKILSKDLNWSKIVYKKEINMETKFIFPKTDSFFFLNHIPVRCCS